MWAASRGHETVVERLIAYGADVHANTPGGWTALMSAASRGHETVAERLIECGAEINAATREGWSSLNYIKNISET